MSNQPIGFHSRERSGTTISSGKTAAVNSVIETQDQSRKWRTTSTLTLTAAAYLDNGEYTCSADFGGSIVEGNSADVIVSGNTFEFIHDHG